MAARLRLFGLSAGLLLLVSAGNAMASEESITRALSARHFNASLADLEKLAGNRDALVGILLNLRQGSPRPFVAVRAERLLVELSDRSDVQAALLEDMNSSSAPGLARIITLRIDRAPTTSARQAIGRAAVERSKRDATFRSYAQELKMSADPSVRRLAVE